MLGMNLPVVPSVLFLRGITFVCVDTISVTIVVCFTHRNVPCHGVFVCLCMCMCVVCVCVCTWVCALVCGCVCVCAHAYVRACVYVCACLCVCVYMYRSEELPLR